ncbi:2-oxoglutarate and iron-dependent oxygenase domain-containing protein [Amphritea sp. 1_MG-2023]|uniref:isopenicillin N synthase family dioxygenase n=1 Tax=Amphritea sp. 1_MG-2023 TaxID=3062670 RepID=UPI0026E2BA0B|nr:2-oxoglutarate and iron-dependent oxygenase domain-containing protein [Amphritea sp. 1_MG-2023]MDO6563664.1 2-oxoglutarate and iron-dependent oxygenase domain-containing protein [Amphritea sp. 1_MG-2023]
MNIPLINISSFYSDDKAEQLKVAHAIDTACRESGFFYIQGHPISQARIDEMRALSAAFFALPEAEKLTIDITRSSNHRGYGRMKAEQLDPHHPSDIKETFDMALNLPADHPLIGSERPLYGPNQYPLTPPDFQQKMERHYWDMLALGKTILSALAMALGIDKAFFEDKFEHPLSVLRFIHYPEVSTDGAPHIGAGAHTDYGCITILWQDETGGLQVQDSNGNWIDAPPIDGAFVINIGNMMARWSNDRYKSTPHRVFSPSGRERYSMPFFVEPDFDTDVSCLENCSLPGTPPKYEPISAGEWMIYCFNNTYAYRGEEKA